MSVTPDPQDPACSPGLHGTRHVHGTQKYMVHRHTWYIDMYMVQDMYMVHRHIHGTQTCTWYTDMYMMHRHVHDSQTCTWYTEIYMAYRHVHDSRTWYTEMYMVHRHTCRQNTICIKQTNTNIFVGTPTFF